MIEDSKMTALELAAMESLLQGDHPSLGILRKQIGRLRVASREMTGVGCFVSFRLDDSTAPMERIKSTRLVIGDGVIKMPSLKNGMGSAIFIEDGVISTLELFTYDEGWPTNLVGAKFSHVAEPRKMPVFD